MSCGFGGLSSHRAASFSYGDGKGTGIAPKETLDWARSAPVNLHDPAGRNTMVGDPQIEGGVATSLEDQRYGRTTAF